MGCSCCTPQAFKMTVGGQDRIVYGLDQVVFATILSFPPGDEEAGRELWRGVCGYNPTIPEEDEELFKKELLKIYHQTKQEYNLTGK